MSIDLGDLFKKALKDERKLLRPYFFADKRAEPAKLVTEEVYLRLRLARMFLKHRRVLFQTKYPVVNALMRFAGMNGKVEVNFVAKPKLAGDSDESRLDDIVTLDQTILGPILYRGGDLELMLGLYSAPADDWAKRFISLAEGISQLTLNATLTTAISMASTIKTSIEDSMSSDGLDLKLGLDKELQENVWLAPGHLVMIAAPDDSIDAQSLVIDGGELFTSKGAIYTDHDYIVLAIEVTSQRSDWQSLGYGLLWQELLKTAAEADDIENVKSAFVTFSGAVLASPDLSWSDRSGIVSLAKERIKAIREARAGTDFLEGLKDADSFLELEMLLTEEAALPTEVDVTLTADSLLQTDWIE